MSKHRIYHMLSQTMHKMCRIRRQFQNKCVPAKTNLSLPSLLFNWTLDLFFIFITFFFVASDDIRALINSSFSLCPIIMEIYLFWSILRLLHSVFIML